MYFVCCPTCATSHQFKRFF
ncbi:hypothetical protein IR195_09400 [Vreelandella venusta]|nr:hypothetical protein IR195_09400 [Halomonas venusta]